MPCPPLVFAAAATSTTTSTFRAFSRTLLSFESLLFGYILFFACDEADEYDAACQFYEKSRSQGREQRWIPVVVIDERALAAAPDSDDAELLSRHLDSLRLDHNGSFLALICGITISHSGNAAWRFVDSVSGATPCKVLYKQPVCVEIEGKGDEQKQHHQHPDSARSSRTPS
ncbi:hypothetical protein FB45DRAFT_1070378 [Roridomyces roridus]|uniref:Uncharacterized protein n=1 Tax=Roridomyces roridus TaxID=1738132 RepID=A0AAD7AYK7_9AGAR|nr:hypothetical protein FB45DRAFT_1070378 [Roridomyces roridus]